MGQTGILAWPEVLIATDNIVSMEKINSELELNSSANRYNLGVHLSFYILQI